MVVSSRPKLVAVELMGYNHAMFGFAPYGPYWRELRKITTLEILSARRVEQLQHVRVSEVQNSIKELYTLWCSQKGESGYVRTVYSLEKNCGGGGPHVGGYTFLEEGGCKES
ncbi:hypothetical protein LR48_Vigan203s000200 [Vigna angularis]|uniref:Cytochrome P450 n=2 Tax=Phaseolus angularis TaxID=3914 RepID=A0A0L9T685_PHAAN|nr:hypothetical protein LR48_Vigan203s000200 [Vigna angularis]BAU01101.1 hypothetical protein VIGAN_11026000 [Vigna angularis var. angularis]